MRTYRSTAVAVLTAALALGTLTAVAAPATAAGVAPLAPAALHPDGVTTFEQAWASPVDFRADAAPGDTAGATGRVHYVVEQRVPAKSAQWHQVASVVGQHYEQIPLPEGDSRWRARFVATDGTLGPWSAWIRFTVDSRRPAPPTVSIPDNPVTVGAPVPVTITSPDGLAAAYYLSDQSGARNQFGLGEDPCRFVAIVCLPPGQIETVVPWAFLQLNFSTLYVTAYGRNGLESSTVAIQPSGLVGPDDTALTAAHRWPIPTTGVGRTKIPDIQGGPALHVTPTLDVATQQIIDFSTSPRQTVDVPSALVTARTTIRTVAPVVDTTKAFSVGAVLRPPATAHGDLRVFDQPGAGGSSFSLVLTSSNSWRFCVSSSVGETACSEASADTFEASSPVVCRYDPVDQVVSLSVGRGVDGEGRQLFTIAPVRPPSGDLSFAPAPVAGTRRYTGPVGSPFVARGWISAPQVTSLLAGAA